MQLFFKTLNYNKFAQLKISQACRKLISDANLSLLTRKLQNRKLPFYNKYINFIFCFQLCFLSCAMKSESTRIPDIKISPSGYSHTGFKIKRHQIKQIQSQNINKKSIRLENSQNNEQNKRKCSDEKETIEQSQIIRKKLKKSSLSILNQKQSNELKLGNLLSLLKQDNDNYFEVQIKNSTQINEQNSIKKDIIFPNKQFGQVKQSQNELLTRKIEIMSNKNQKISIPIHQGLYKSNTSHKNSTLKQNNTSIPNLCDFKMKNQYSQSIQFIREYKSGYTPILMQKKNQEEIAEDKTQLNQTVTKNPKDKSRNHFIRKQQSTLSLPRTCGVSYIKPSESLSTQKPPFQPLPPLIFQGSTSCSIGANGQTISSIDFHQKTLIQQFTIILQNQWLPFISSDEDQMRDLLLSKKTKKAKVGFVQGVQNLWPLFAEGSFILIFICFEKITTQTQVWQAFLNKKNFFKIGILSKRSISGKKAFLKSIKSEGSQTISVASLETYQNQMKDENPNQNGKLEKTFGSYQSRISIDLRDSPSEQKKVSNTFEIFEEQLKDSRTVITMGLRLQMYVQEMDWKQKYSKENKTILNQIIMTLKDRLQKKSIKIITQRIQLARQAKINYFDQKLDFLRVETNEQKSYSNQKENISFKVQNNQKNLNIISSLFEGKNRKIFELYSELKYTLIQNTVTTSPSYFLNGICTEQSWRKSLRFPLYYISTRDSFAFDLIEKKTVLKRSNGRQYTKIQYFFYPDNVPTNFGSQYKRLFPNLNVGLVAYHDFFTESELKKFQENTFQMQKNAFRNKFAQMTVQPSIVSTKIKRTKFFFGYRYMWTRCQLSEPCSYVGAGVRKDVASPPTWTKEISDEMVKDNIVEKDFINSIAINVYHDGKEGLAQHFDDAVRFKQPIYTLRLFSDARLSFGSQFYGFCNGAFIIPLPRGCILVMQENSYAANGVKHCVRPCDMTGKSAAVILRQMHSQVVSQASKYDELIDFPAWLSCLSEDKNSITFSQQKRLEAQQIMKTKTD